MPAGFWLIILMIVIVGIWVIAKIRYNMRLSEQQWRDADKSKLREWDDEDDWPGALM